MEKILNILKYNTYGSNIVLNKYIYMKRIYNNYKSYYIFYISSILNDKFPIIYECKRGFELCVDNKSSLVKKFNKLELTNNDILYNINIDEYLGIFRTFVMCEGSNLKIDDNLFEC